MLSPMNLSGLSLLKKGRVLFFVLGIGIIAFFPLSLRAQNSSPPLRIGFIPVLGAAPLFIAQQEGWAKAEGLALEMKLFESGALMIQALASGSLDLYVGGIAPLAVARARGVEVKVLMSTAINEMTFVAGPELAPFFEKGGTPAEAFRRFQVEKGRPARLSTQPPGTVPHTTLLYWLKVVTQTPPEAYQLLPMGIDENQQALLAGAVDGTTLREPANTLVMAHNPAIRTIVTGNDMFPHQPGTVIGVSKRFLDQHPQEILKIIRMVNRALDLLRTQPAQAAPAVEAFLGKGLIDHAQAVQALQAVSQQWTGDPRDIMDSTEKMQKFQKTIGTLDQEVSREALFDPSLYVKSQITLKEKGE